MYRHEHSIQNLLMHAIVPKNRPSPTPHPEVIIPGTRMHRDSCSPRTQANHAAVKGRPLLHFSCKYPDTKTVPSYTCLPSSISLKGEGNERSQPRNMSCRRQVFFTPAGGCEQESGYISSIRRIHPGVDQRNEWKQFRKSAISRRRRCVDVYSCQVARVARRQPCYFLVPHPPANNLHCV